ncbi:MAG: hypothetical protein K5745_02730 [Saccharofermentans sp.]|nr:hypothetical protein [Saccharofermentans sp.]
MDDCLVYFFTGFLGSGKTSVISSWLDGENFGGHKSVVINTEEGEEEYLAENYPKSDPVVINCETEEVTKELIFDIERKYRPELVFIEWNGSVSPKEFFDNVDVPERWMLAASIVIVDCSTYADYYKNMGTFFADYYRFCDTVIFNRVDPEKDNIPKLRGSVKAVNPSASINFLSKDMEIIRIEDHLPYDLKQNPCNIAADDFGLFYTDAFDNAQRYNGKRVSLIGQAVCPPEMNGRAFGLQREAYTCCAEDIAPMGIICIYKYGSNFPKGQWLKVTGTVGYFEDQDENGQKMLVPCLNVEDYAITSQPENVIIYFN